MRQHEPDKTDRWCVHCGALRLQFAALGCVERPGVEPAPEPTRRVAAADDAGAIAARIAELRRERDAVLARPPDNSDLPAPGEDWCCG